MKKNTILPLIGVGLLLYAISKKDSPPQPSETTRALSSPFASDAMTNISETFGQPFAQQLETAVATSQTAGEVFEKLGYGATMEPIQTVNLGGGTYALSATGTDANNKRDPGNKAVPGVSGLTYDKLWRQVISDARNHRDVLVQAAYRGTGTTRTALYAKLTGQTVESVKRQAQIAAGVAV